MEKSLTFIKLTSRFGTNVPLYTQKLCILGFRSDFQEGEMKNEFMARIFSDPQLRGGGTLHKGHTYSGKRDCRKCGSGTDKAGHYQ